MNEDRKNTILPANATRNVTDITPPPVSVAPTALPPLPSEVEQTQETRTNLKPNGLPPLPSEVKIANNEVANSLPPLTGEQHYFKELSNASQGYILENSKPDGQRIDNLTNPVDVSIRKIDGENGDLSYIKNKLNENYNNFNPNDYLSPIRKLDPNFMVGTENILTQYHNLELAKIQNDIATREYLKNIDDYYKMVNTQISLGNVMNTLSLKTLIDPNNPDIGSDPFDVREQVLQNTNKTYTPDKTFFEKYLSFKGAGTAFVDGQGSGLEQAKRMAESMYYQNDNLLGAIGKITSRTPVGMVNRWSSSFLTTVFGNQNDFKPKIDLNFNPKEEYFSTVNDRRIDLSSISEDDLKYLLNAPNKVEFDDRMGRVLQDAEYDRQHNNGNLASSLSFGIAESLSNPIETGVSAVTGMGGIKALNKIVQAKTGIQALGVAAVGEAIGGAAGVALLQKAQGNTYTSDQLVMDMVAGSVFGGAANAAFRGYGVISRNGKINRTTTQVENMVERNLIDQGVEASVAKSQAKEISNAFNTVLNQRSADIELGRPKSISKIPDDSLRILNTFVNEVNQNKNAITKNKAKDDLRARLQEEGVTPEQKIQQLMNDTKAEVDIVDFDFNKLNELGYNITKLKNHQGAFIDKDGVIRIDPRAYDNSYSPKQIQEFVRAAEITNTQMRAFDPNTRASVAQTKINLFNRENANLKLEYGSKIKHRADIQKDINLQGKSLKVKFKEPIHALIADPNKLSNPVYKNLLGYKDVILSLHKEFNNIIRKSLDTDQSVLDGLSKIDHDRKSKHGHAFTTTIVQDFDKIMPNQVIEKHVKKYYKDEGLDRKAIAEKIFNNEAKDILTGNIFSIRQRRQDILQDMYNNSVEPQPRVNLPEIKSKIKELEELSKPNEPTVRTKEDIYNKYGIDKKYWSYEPEQAFHFQLMEKEINRVTDDILNKIKPEIKKAQETIMKAMSNKAYFENFIPPTIQMLESNVKAAVYVGMAFENPLGTVLNNTVPMIRSRLLNQMNHSTNFEVNYNLTRDKFINGYSKLSKVSDIITGEATSKFNDAFMGYYRLNSTELRMQHPLHEEFKDLALSVAKVFDMDRRLRKELALEGSDLLPDKMDEFYFPEYISPKKFELLNVSQQREFANSLTRGMVKHGVDEEIAERLADGMLRKLHARLAAGDNFSANSFGNNNIALLEDILNSQILQERFSAAERSEVRAIIRKELENSKLSKTKKDLNEVIEGTTLTVADLLDNDLFLIAKKRMNQTAGKVSLYERLGFRDKVDIDNYRLFMEANGASKSEIETFNLLMAETMGQPYGNNSPGTASTIATSLARSLMLVLAGFSQLMETGNIFIGLGVRDGLKTVARGIQSTGRVKQLAKTGKVNDDLMNSLRDAGYSFEEIYAARSFYNFDRDITEQMSLNSNDARQVGSLLKKVQNGTLFLESAVNTLSGMKMVIAGQKQAVFETSLVKAINLYKKGDLQTDIELTNAGFNVKDLEDAFNSGVFEFNEKGKLVRINPDANGTAAYNVLTSAKRFTDQIIQDTHIGERGSWYHNGTMRLLLLMRSYTVNAMFKQTGRRLANDSLTNFMLKTAGWAMFNSIIVGSRIMFNAGTMTDDEKRAEYLEKNLKLKSLMLGGLMYSGTLGLGGDALNLITAAVSPQDSAWNKIGTGGFVSQVVPILGFADRVATGLHNTGGMVRNQFRDEENKENTTIERTLKVTPFAGTPVGKVTIAGGGYIYNTFSGN